VFGVDLLMSLVASRSSLACGGVVLISALLIMPGAAARFWTDRLSTLLVLSGIFGFGVGLVGTWLSASLDQLPAGPIIVLSGTALFVFHAAAGGRLARWLDQRRFETTPTCGSFCGSLGNARSPARAQRDDEGDSLSQDVVRAGSASCSLRPSRQAWCDRLRVDVFEQLLTAATRFSLRGHRCGGVPPHTRSRREHGQSVELSIEDHVLRPS
jgi:hypothetical protein